MHSKKNRLKILISAYSCSPILGSEAAVGWGFVSHLSKHHDVFVITQYSKFKPAIDVWREKEPFLNQIRFYGIDRKRNENIEAIWPPSYYWTYRDWQKEAYILALELDRNENFDIIHQLNMVGFREPGYLWKIDKPFVWGPIGGLENSPWNFLPSLGLKGLVFYAGRNIFNLFQRKLSKRAKQAAMRNNATLIAATPGNQDLIEELWNTNSQVICEVGQENQGIEIVHSKRTTTKEPLKIIWSGLHTPGKNLPLLLNALEKVNFPFELHILGKGEMTRSWKNLAKNVGVQDHCHWYGWLERQKAIEIMSTGHVFCITSISDLTSTVTLEALSYGLPIVCLDHCGFAHVVTEECGIKIPVNTPKEAANNIAKALSSLYDDESYRQSLSKGSILRASHFSWEKKIENLNSIYNSLLEKSN